jgi:ABC-2 type transport system permease protein
VTPTDPTLTDSTITDPTLTGPAGAAPAALELVAVVARREIVARLRDRTFIISTVFLLLLIAASVTVPLVLTGRGAPALTVATVGPRSADVADAARALGAAAVRAGEDAQDQPGGKPAAQGLPAAAITVRQVPDAAAAESLVRAGTADAALVPTGADGASLQLVAQREVPPELERLVAAASATDYAVSALESAGMTPARARAVLAGGTSGAPAQRLLDPPSKNTDLAIGSSTAFAMLFFLTTFLFGMAIAQSVVEEKQSRIVEILVAAIPVRVLLAGKVLGNTALALGQITLFVAVGLAGASVAGQTGLVALLLRSSPWFLLYFLLGFSMLACLWAAAGAVAGRQEDLQATTVPLQVLLFVPFFSATYVYAPGPLLTTLSYVPFTAPIAMPRRLALEDAAWWEGVLAAAGVALTAALFVAAATRIYERSLLRAGTRISWLSALRLHSEASDSTSDPATHTVPQGV